MNKLYLCQSNMDLIKERLQVLTLSGEVQSLIIQTYLKNTPVTVWDAISCYCSFIFNLPCKGDPCINLPVVQTRELEKSFHCSWRVFYSWKRTERNKERKDAGTKKLFWFLPTKGHLAWFLKRQGALFHVTEPYHTILMLFSHSTSVLF